MHSEPVRENQDGVVCAVRHALAWLVVGNAVGLYLSVLLLAPSWQLAPWTYGRWVPVHLNVQLYGWTALPLVAWLFSIYEVDRSRFANWAPAAVWAWSSALAMGAYHWLNGTTGGKIFLDWKDAALWGFVVAMVMLWLVLCLSWKDQASHWTLRKMKATLAGLIGLAFVPVSIIITASPKTYPPVDRLTGGPSGSSLLGSSLIVVGLILLLPRVLGTPGKGKAGWGTWSYFAACWLYFGIAEAIGGTHLDWWQNSALFLMPPWAWLLIRDGEGFSWPPTSRLWRVSMLGWWGALTLTGYLMYFPWILERIKFTQGLVAHSHLAMAGFTTSFCAFLIVLMTGRNFGAWKSALIWQGSVLAMLLILATMGWQEGLEPSWMITQPTWREAGLVLRSLCGVLMLLVSINWFAQWKNP
jgi:cytochrome c oxidase cbb3-type subunit I